MHSPGQVVRVSFGLFFCHDALFSNTEMWDLSIKQTYRAFTQCFTESKVLPKSRNRNLPAVLHGEHCSAGWCCISGPSGRIAVEHHVSLGSANFVLMFDRELEHISFTSIQSNWQLDRVRASRLTTRLCARIRRKDRLLCVYR